MGIATDDGIPLGGWKYYNKHSVDFLLRGGFQALKILTFVYF